MAALHTARAALLVVLVVVALLGGRVAAQASWQPDCASISSGCTSCRYVTPTRSTGSRSSSSSSSSSQPAAADAAGRSLALRISNSTRARLRSRRVSPGEVNGTISSSSSSNNGSSSSYSSRRRRSDATVTAQRSSRSSGSGSGSDKVNWGSNSYWWQPGQVLSCTSCDAAGNYALVTPSSGVAHCGCAAGFGVVPLGDPSSGAWPGSYVKQFTCEACTAGSVPFTPESNLVATWDGQNWALECQGSSGSSSSSGTGSTGGAAVGMAPHIPLGGSSGTAAGRLPHTGTGSGSSSSSTGGGSSGGSSGGTAVQEPPATGPFGGTNSVAPAAAAGAHRAVSRPVNAARARRFYAALSKRQQGSSSGFGTAQQQQQQQQQQPAPWWPGECVACALAGATADPTSTFCECGGGPSPPPSPRPPPSPPPSPSPPSGACVTCVASDITSEIQTVCSVEPATGSVYLSDQACSWVDSGITDVTYTSTPNVLDTTNFPDEMPCALLAPRQNSQVTLVATASGSALGCSPAASTTVFTVPNFQNPPPPSPRPPSPPPSPSPLPRPSPSPLPQPSPSPAPRPPSPSPSPPPSPSSPSPRPPGPSPSPAPPPPPASPSPRPPPGPSPSPSPPTPVPSPSPGPTNACLTCDPALLSTAISTDCADTTEVDVYQACDFSNMADTDTPVFGTVPDVGSTSGPDFLSCAKLSTMPGGTFNMSWIVSGAALTCSPVDGWTIVTVPAFAASSPSPSPAQLSPSPSPAQQSPSPSPAQQSPSPSPAQQSPSPSPAQQSPSPSPSPPSSPAPVGDGCVVCDVGWIQDNITTACTIDPNAGAVYLWQGDTKNAPCTSADPKVQFPYFYVTPDVSFDGNPVWDCSKLVSQKGRVLRLRILVDELTDPGITCSPNTTNYNVTVPRF